MSPLTQTPIISVWVNVVFCALLGLIDLGSYTAISAIFNVTRPTIPVHRFFTIPVKPQSDVF